MSEENTAAKKPFFKSISFKCIVVLLIIALVSGIFLTLCNALFEVTETERLERSLAKLYDDASVTYDADADTTPDSSISVEDAAINKVYKITSIDGEGTDSEYVLNVTGEGGFSGGTVTCDIRVYVDSTAKTCEVKKISISEYDSSQSYIAKISASDLTALVNQQSSSSFTAFTTDGINCGATYSLTAVSNATNAALTYAKAKYLGISDVVITVYDDFDYTEKIDKEATTHAVDGETVTYAIITKKYVANPFTIEITVDSTETVVNYEIITNGSTAVGYANDMYDVSVYVGMGADEILALLDVENNKVSSSDLKTGASYSNYLCAYAALFATANYRSSVELGTVENAVVDAEVNE